MTVTIQAFNHSFLNLANGNVNLSSDTLKIALLYGYTFSAADEEYTDIAGYEIDEEFGYTTGGVELDGVTWTVATGKTKLDADDMTLTASGGAVGPFDTAVVYSETSGYLLYFVDLGAEATVPDGDSLLFTFGADGILSVEPEAP